ncbi:helix-turn-helix domain-containing protein, partial [Aeromonas caviae]
KLIGYSRQQFYEIRRNYQTYGAEGLLDKLPGCKGAHPNRVAPEIEQAILDYSLT